MADLAAFLARAGKTPFAYGVFDCGLWLADWIVETGRPDPAAHLRGTYSDRAGCEAVLEAAGGMRGLVTGLATVALLTAANTASAGAVGVLWIPTLEGRALAGGICTGPRWAILTTGGLMSAPANPVAAWAA